MCSVVTIRSSLHSERRVFRKGLFGLPMQMSGYIRIPWDMFGDLPLLGLYASMTVEQS